MSRPLNHFRLLQWNLHWGRSGPMDGVLKDLVSPDTDNRYHSSRYSNDINRASSVVTLLVHQFIG